MNNLDDAAREVLKLDRRIERAAKALLSRQQADGHWVFELEADATIPAEYILLRQFLGEPDDLTLERKIGVYLRRRQGEHHGWPLVHGGPFDISASIKAYYALKMIGDDPDAAHMAAARTAIRAHGGPNAANVFTRIQLALFGQMDWARIPTMPVELILLPDWFPIHLNKMSYWARTVIVPLLVLQTSRPVARNPRGVGVAELYDGAAEIKPGSKAADPKRLWTWGFAALDVLLKAIEPFWPKTLRARAIAACRAFVETRLNGRDGLGAIYPAMANSVMMYDALGVPPEQPDRAIARESVERLLVVKPDEAYCQPCISPVWDTGLACHTLLELGDEAAVGAAARGLDWLEPLQVLDVEGDWAHRRPGVRPGGWAFQYANPYYPDLDDTAVVVMAMDRARTEGGGDPAHAIARGREWVEGLQSRNGGWGAFDADNTYHYLNNIPFADHGALLDPPTDDVTARCISMLAQLGVPRDEPRMAAALAFLAASQRPDGSWFGRWGVNYIYGTWSVLCALNAAGLSAEAPMVRRALDWLIAIQNEDGGWGEGCESYDLGHAGHRAAPSAASQTAWAVMGLMAAGQIDHPAVVRGIAWLLRTEDAEGFWPEPGYTGGGFPRVFYLRYHGYSKYFPLWALARYRRLARTNSRHVGVGM
ncbi:squalene--hopene cyclase [Phenylobacterium sp.]|uniref:squalene--hopene cyclase n=1 Tax=Phenylobacterium sp. TaxID=1871053 RepID=UPI002F41017D